jgi:hypothetical protein
VQRVDDDGLRGVVRRGVGRPVEPADAVAGVVVRLEDVVGAPVGAGEEAGGGGTDGCEFIRYTILIIVIIPRRPAAPDDMQEDRQPGP